MRFKDDKGKKSGPPEPKPSIPASGDRDDLTIEGPLRPDTMLQRVSSLFSQSDMIPALQKKLKACTVKHSDIANFQFAAFVTNLKGMNKFKIAGTLLIAVRTRNNSFLISNVACETLYDRCAGLMGIDLKKRVILTNGDSALYLYKVGGEDLRQLQSLSSMTPPKVILKDSINPVLQDGNLDEAAFREKLKTCTYLNGNLEGFDLAEFADTVSFIYRYEDTKGNGYYLVMAGEKDDIYRLYVNCNDHDEFIFSGMAVLRHGTEMCRLYKED